MVKRKRGSRTSESVIKPAKNLENPSFFTPCTDPEIPEGVGVAQDSISFKCKGCGKSDNHPIESGYRLVKTALLVEVGTQTGDEAETQLEDSDALVDPEVGTNNSIPATSSSSEVW